MLRRVLMAGAGAAPAVGSPPSAYGGLTFWYDGDNSAHYSGDTSTSGTPSDAGACERIDSVAGISRCFTLNPATTLRDYAFFGETSGLRTADEASARGFGYVNPSAGVSPSTPLALSNLFTASNAVIVFCVWPFNLYTGQSPYHYNACLLSDDSANLGLTCYDDGAGACLFEAFNKSGSHARVTAAAVAMSQWHVVTMRHSSGQLRIRVDGGSWTSIASGNTSGLTTQPVLFRKYPGLWFNGLCAQFCTYNAARTDAEILEVEKYFGAKVGLAL